MVVLMMSVTITKKNVILQIVKFLQDIDNENIIILNILHRFDLSDNSYVNEEFKNLIWNWRKLQNCLILLKFWNWVLIETFSLSMVCIWINLAKGC